VFASEAGVSVVVGVVGVVVVAVVVVVVVIEDKQDSSPLLRVPAGVSDASNCVSSSACSFGSTWSCAFSQSLPLQPCPQKKKTS